MVRWYQKTLEMVYSTVNSQKEKKGREYVRLIREALSITNTNYIVKMNNRFLMKISIPVILLLLTIMSASAQTSGNSTTYSVVHISDNQYLASHYPETYDYTFSYLDSIKQRYNISAIIITGDLVDTWDDKKEWDVYSHAVHETSIPVYVIAGNHDISDKYDYQYYTQYTGNTKNTYVTSFENFDLVGINSVYESFKPQEIASLRKTLINSPKNMTIIATHYYMDENGTLSSLGTDISQQLIVKPTIILAGHVKGAFVRDRMIGQNMVIEDLTNYQGGIPGGSGSRNISAGTFYTITTRDGLVEKISSKIIWISPRQYFDNDHVLYDISVPEPDVEPSKPEVTPDCDSIPGVCGSPSIFNLNEYWNTFIEFFKGIFRFS
jgi:predicted MPP superfamily phosphohydrolase